MASLHVMFWQLPSPWRRAIGLSVMIVVAVGFSGCNRGPAMYQVRGVVLYKDGSVPKGGVALVRFQPSEDSPAEIRKGASSAIGDDGSFELYTRKAGDGVYEGKYDVSFLVQKGVMDATPLIQTKYMNAASSGYNVTVDRNLSDLKFEIEPLPGAPRAAAGRQPTTGG